MPEQSTALAGFSGDIFLYGCGTMAGAMLTRWLDCGLNPARVIALRQSGAQAAPGVCTIQDARGEPAPAIMLIGVKPHIFGQVAESIAPLTGPETLVISIMAGVTLESLTDALALSPDAAIVRAMPNLPVADGRGVVAIAGADTLTPQAAAQLGALMAPLGLIHHLPDEGGCNLVTALTGCGPAFVYRFVAAMAGAAVRLGMDPVDADALARATVAGAADTIARSDQSPVALADAVASPGGMTQAGLDILDSDGRLTALMADTLRAARDRGRELAATATKKV